MSTRTLESAALLWSYLSAPRHVEAADAVVLCCSYDLRVCDHACELVDAGLARTLVISGASGNWTRHLWEEPEARVFAARAIDNGIDPSRILLEQRAVNLGENVRFSRDLVARARRVIFVSKPNTLLRLRLTVAAQWPRVQAFYSCPELAFPDDVSPVIGLWGLIHEMVGDIDRVRRYPALGYQAEHEMPPAIVDCWEYLVEQGFTGHLADGA